uniref:Uncharacterized protein n=1 Tax=Oncorhynchus tshawytscha TaxID=74940 RepID=A0A8C8BTC6_ONCTS
MAFRQNSLTCTISNEMWERLKAIKHTHNLFKLQQVLFIAALEFSSQVLLKIIYPSLIAHIQGYMEHHCINATDLHIFTLFLKIVEDKLQAHVHQGPSSTIDMVNVGLFCLFSNPGPFFVSSYPHDKVNRLSCDEARNYYSGVVSLIPLALELLINKLWSRVLLHVPSLLQEHDLS